MLRDTEVDYARAAICHSTGVITAKKPPTNVANDSSDLDAVLRI